MSYSTGPDSRVISSYPSGVWVIFRLFLYIPISFSSLKDLGQIRAEYHDVRPTAPAETGCQGLVDVRHLAVAGFAHYLPGRLADAYQRGSPDRVRRYYASRRVDRQHTVHAEGVLADQLGRAALVAEPQGVHPLHAAGRGGKVKLGHVELLQGIGDARDLVRRRGAALKRRHPLPLQVSEVRVVVAHDRRVDPRRPREEPLRLLLRGEYHRAGAVGAGAHVEELDGVGKHGGAHDVLHGARYPVVGVRIVEGVVAVPGSDERRVLLGRPVGLHVHGVLGGQWADGARERVPLQYRVRTGCDGHLRVRLRVLLPAHGEHHVKKPRGRVVVPAHANGSPRGPAGGHLEDRLHERAQPVGRPHVHVVDVLEIG